MATMKVKRIPGNVAEVYNDTDSTYNVTTRVVSNGVCVTVTCIRTSGSGSSSGWATVATIPQGYRPFTEFQAAFTDSNNNRAIMNVSPDGSVKWYKIPANLQFHGCISYPI